MTVHERIARQAAATPDRVAAQFEGRPLTYAELEARGSRLARRLQRLGIGPETRVAVCMDRSLDLLAVLLGVLKAGGAYVPLDPAYPSDRLAFMVEDAGAAVLVTDPACRNVIHQSSAPTLCVDETVGREADSEAIASPVAVDGENLAYVIYTSGSTGKPKGVQIPHRALINFLDSMREEPGITGEDVLLAV